MTFNIDKVASSTLRLLRYANCNGSSTRLYTPLLTYISDANDKETKEVTLGIFLDLLQTFDSINHDILLYKLHFYGMRGIRNMCFPATAYLPNRKQYIEYDDKSSLKTLLAEYYRGLY